MVTKRNKTRRESSTQENCHLYKPYLFCTGEEMPRPILHSLKQRAHYVTTSLDTDH